MFEIQNGSYTKTGSIVNQKAVKHQDKNVDPFHQYTAQLSAET
jgi:hypothetical protein